MKSLKKKKTAHRVLKLVKKENVLAEYKNHDSRLQLSPIFVPYGFAPCVSKRWIYNYGDEPANRLAVLHAKGVA